MAAKPRLKIGACNRDADGTDETHGTNATPHKYISPINLIGPIRGTTARTDLKPQLRS
jgi:hypothetical protein